MKRYYKYLEIMNTPTARMDSTEPPAKPPIAAPIVRPTATIEINKID